MDKRILIVLVLVIVIVAGIGAAILILSKQTTTVQPTPTTAPVATPITASPTGPSISTQIGSPLTSAGPGTIDVYLDSKGQKMDGFQFIASLSGSSLPAVPDADTLQDGVQISPAPIPELSISTNTVTEEDGKFVIRFAMVATDSTLGFTSQTPIKIASIPVSNGSSGSVTLTFNQQNSRARLTAGGDDALLGVSDGTFPVSAQTASIASDSASPASLTAAVSTTPPPSTSPANGATSPFCLASCFTDSDCAAGFSCQTDRCVNPACPTSQTCGCGTTQTTATAAPVIAVATATPRPTATPRATSAPVAIATDSASPENLPVSGAFEYTLLMIGAGLLLLGGGIFMVAKQEA